MRLPDGKILRHAGEPYDPKKAHEYYMRTRHLKGRQKGTDVATVTRPHAATSPARAKQKEELKQSIHGLETRLKKLEALIRKREHEAASENRKAKAKQNTAAKEKDKPKTAAEKAKTNRENKKYRDKHKQSLKTKSKEASGKGGSSKSASSKTKKHSVEELKTLATKVRGQIAVAKQKLAAL